MPPPDPPPVRRSSGLTCLAAVALVVPGTLTGCLVAGYSSGSGLWVWPGSMIVTLILVLLYFLMRHR